ncbi:MAG: hypothetical protein JXP73_16090 [Deltaproteobacteria bacterium]|nr:hypothetical protein [Deltaproteobacteria bacterium]
MKAIVGKNAREIAPRLLGFLSFARQSGLRADVLWGEAGELCVLPHDDDETDAAAGPRHFVKVGLRGDRVEIEGGHGFRVTERREAQGALEIATAVSVPGRPRAHWRQRVLFALRDAEVLGRVVRALLERGRDRLSFARVACDSVHPGTEFLLLVRDAPLYVVLQVLEEDLGHAFYEASHAQVRDKLLGLFLPWGRDFPLVAALGARLERPCVRQTSGRLAGIDVDALSPIDAVLAPELRATSLSVAHVPHGELRVTVPLRLVALDKGQIAEPTELWRAGPEMLEQLATELSCAEDRLAGLLAQVVRLGDDADPSVFIWAPTGADEDGERPAFADLPGFARARRRLGNLLLPARHAVLPTLADETLRSVFGLGQGTLTLVDAAKDATLLKYRLRVDDFRPLRATLVEYAMHAHERELAQVCAAAEFDFESVELPPAEPCGEAPAAAPEPRRPSPRPGHPNDDEDAEEEAQPATATAEGWAAPATASEEAAPTTHWPTRLEQATQALIDVPADEERWLGFLEASLALGHRLDANLALLRLLPGCEPTRARSLLAAGLGVAGRVAERDVLAALAAAETPLDTLPHGLEQVLGLALVALDPPEPLAPDVRRGIGRLPARVRALGLPRLTWAASALAWQLTRDAQALEDARLWLEPGLLTLGVREAAPPLVAEALEARNGEASRAAVRVFADAAALGRPERVFLRLAYALRLLVLGGGVDGAYLAELSAELEAARADLGKSAEQVDSALRTLEHVRAHSLASLADFGVDPNLRTVLIEEGYLPPQHASAETRVLREGAELAAASAADAASRVVELFDEVSGDSYGGLDALFSVVSRLRRAGHRDALVALRARVAETAARTDDAGRCGLLLATLATGLSAALDPEQEPTPSYAELVERTAKLQMWDLAASVRAVLSALEPLPVAMRRRRAVPLYRALRERGAIRPWTGERTIRVDEQRALLRLVNLLVVPVEETPDAERLCHAEWTSLRETMRRDLERARPAT